MIRAIVSAAGSAVVALGLVLGPANLTASAASAPPAPAAQVVGRSHQALAAAVQPAVAKVDLVSMTKPLMPAGPNWRCYGNVLIWDPSVCIYVRYYGTKVVSIQGQIWMRLQGPLTGTWTMGWGPRRGTMGARWYEGPNGRYFGTFIANHWTTAQITFNRTVPRNTYVYFARSGSGDKGHWYLKRTQVVRDRCDVFCGAAGNKRKVILFAARPPV